MAANVAEEKAITATVQGILDQSNPVLDRLHARLPRPTAEELREILDMYKRSIRATVIGAIGSGAMVGAVGYIAGPVGVASQILGGVLGGATGAAVLISDLVKRAESYHEQILRATCNPYFNPSRLASEPNLSILLRLLADRLDEVPDSFIQTQEFKRDVETSLSDPNLNRELESIASFLQWAGKVTLAGAAGGPAAAAQVAVTLDPTSVSDLMATIIRNCVNHIRDSELHKFSDTQIIVGPGKIGLVKLEYNIMWDREDGCIFKTKHMDFRSKKKVVWFNQEEELRAFLRRLNL